MGGLNQVEPASEQPEQLEPVRGGGRTDGCMGGQIYGWNFSSVFYRTSFPIGSNAQKEKNGVSLSFENAEEYFLNHPPREGKKYEIASRPGG